MKKPDEALLFILIYWTRSQTSRKLNFDRKKSMRVGISSKRFWKEEEKIFWI